jgi:hypothetical protein
MHFMVRHVTYNQAPRCRPLGIIEKSTLGRVVNGGRRHAEQQEELLPSAIIGGTRILLPNVATK